jgi:hypothetical protein
MTQAMGIQRNSKLARSCAVLSATVILPAWARVTITPALAATAVSIPEYLRLPQSIIRSVIHFS